MKAWKGGKRGREDADRHLIRREMDTHVSHILSFPSDVHVITLLQRITCAFAVIVARVTLVFCTFYSFALAVPDVARHEVACKGVFSAKLGLV